MNCPQDGSALEVRESGGAVGCACKTCNGWWLPYRHMEALQHLILKFPTGKFAQLIVEGSLAETALPCPSGCGSLTSTQVAAIQLDWCRRCKGVWFDRQELTKTMRLYIPKTSSDGWPVDIDILGALLSTISFD